MSVVTRGYKRAKAFLCELAGDSEAAENLIIDIAAERFRSFVERANRSVRRGNPFDVEAKFNLTSINLGPFGWQGPAFLSGKELGVKIYERLKSELASCQHEDISTLALVFKPSHGVIWSFPGSIYVDCQPKLPNVVKRQYFLIPA